MQKKVAGAN